MESYLYPQNLKETPKLWLWEIKDIAIGGIALLISIVSLTQIGWILPFVGTLVYAFLTIKLDDTSILDFIKRASRFFIFGQQFYVWKLRAKKGVPHEKEKRP
ncbi:MAG TPA: hypothetical protein DEP23_05975 [Ruminococcaceae bacterium]|nr:hypothetical protein [Oscillospiraceae bacterium]